MKFIKLFCACALLLLCSNALAQFYAPETERHDPVQRMYVVELARILAWYENHQHPGIEEVKYLVTTKSDGTTVWELKWLEEGSKTRLQARIEYPASLLESGTGFYRKVGDMLTHQEWRRRFHATTQENSTSNYWKGASQMGVSREESLASSFPLLAKFEEHPVEAIPQLAGLLTHAAILSATERMTIDCMLAARGAAWLFLAERSAANQIDTLWAPVLFMGGREAQARELWLKGYPSRIESATPQQAGWNVWLRGPTSKEVYLYATEPKNLGMGMAMMASDSFVNETPALFVEAVTLSVPEAQSIRLHNFGPRFAVSGISGGRLLEGFYPFYQRLGLLKLLQDFKPEQVDFKGYTNQLASALSYKPPQTNADIEEGSLLGLSETAPLLRLGRKEGVGPLAPVGAVSARDLLNYAWEMAGAELGSRYQFVQNSWGVPDVAKTILNESTRLVEGWMPFFLNESSAKTFNYRETQLRLQLIDGMKDRVGWSANPFAADAGQNSAQLFVKRAWLRPRELDWQSRCLWDAGDFKGVEVLMKAAIDQGGPISSAYGITYLNAVLSDAEGLKLLPAAPSLAKEFAAKAAQPTARLARAIGLQKLDNYERGQRYEEMYWRNPDSGLEFLVFRNYLVSGAFKSARRFYGQVRENLLDPVSFSNGMGTYA